MSSDQDRELIASLRRGYAAFNRADFDAAIEVFDPAVVYVPAAGQKSLEGSAALRAWMEPDAFEEQTIEPLEVRINGKKVLVRQHIRGRGAGSGIEVEAHTWVVLTLNDDGLVAQLEAFQVDEERQALAAAGLSE